jgi:hypothetical protein
MRRVILNRIAKRTAYGFLLIAASYLVVVLGIQKALLGARFNVSFLDFSYVLAVTFLPQLLQWTGYGVLFSVVFLLLKYKIFPVHRLERHYLGIKRGNLRKSLFIMAVLAFLLFVVPYFMRSQSIAGDVISGADQSSMQLGSGLASIGGYAGILLSNLVFILAGMFNFFVIKPLYLFYPVRVDAVLCAVFLSALFYHSMLVSIGTRRSRVSRHVSKHLCQQGDKIVLRTSLKCGFPSPGMSLQSGRTVRGRAKELKSRSKKNIACTAFDATDEFVPEEGYYNFDIVPVSIFTLPFFHTTIYKVCDENSDVSVVPALKYRALASIRRPVVARETGSLIRRQLGSSLDFADMREYTHEDPLSRIWWKGFAKYGDLMVKQFHSFAEDRWMLVLDFTDQNLGEERVKTMLRFSRIFIELCTRKDIAIGLSTFSPTFNYIDYEVNKRDLLSSLTRVTMPLYEVSPRGLELILHDALGPDMEKLKKKCRTKRMTLSMAYSYSGLGKRKSFLSWKGGNVFKDCMRKFFTNLKKSGKIVMVTSGDAKNMEMLKKFKATCERRRCSYLIVVAEPKKGVADQLRKARVKHIAVPYERLAKPNFVLRLVSLV